MSKKEETLDSIEPAAETTTAQPSVYDELLQKGTTILEAPTREALAELIDNIPAENRYAVGAVGRKTDGSAYTIRVDLI
jgi:hypothetical protein